MNTTLPNYSDMLEELVASPSVSSAEADLDQSNRDVIELLAQWLDELGFVVELMPVTENKFNLIATAGQGDNGLLLSGHTDTVPFDEAQWQSDPFRLSHRDDRLYGLGATDMKGFFPLVLEVFNQLDLKKLQRPLTLLATADEETTMAGARMLQDNNRVLGRYAVIGEPTGLQPVHMHKGMMMESIRLRGRSGHSSDPGLGENALEGMHKLIGDLLEWRQEFQKVHRNHAFEVKVPTMNLGCIHGGDNPNRICGDCELQIDLRPLPGMHLQELREQLAHIVHQSIEGSNLTAELSSLFPGIEAMETPKSSFLVQQMEQLTGSSARTVAFGTEAPFFNAMGMDTVIFGPGDINQAHQPDEYIALDKIAPAREVLLNLIQGICITENDL